MQNRKGFTIIELLVVVGIIGLLASLAVVSFGAAQQRARDAKRVADMRSVMSAFGAAALTESQPLLCDGANAISGNLLLSAVRIVNGATCAGTDVTKSYINLANLKDPSYPGVVCAGPLPNANCDYTMYLLPTPSMAGQSATFSVGFVTESNKPANLAASNWHTADNAGMQ